MKRQMAIVAALIVFMGCSHDKDKEKDTESSLTMNDLPAAVQSTVTANLNGGTVTYIHGRKRHNDSRYYKVYFTNHDKYFELLINEDGRLLKIRHETADHEEIQDESH